LVWLGIADNEVDSVQKEGKLMAVLAIISWCVIAVACNLVAVVGSVV